jgi:hypothetical protein
MWRRRRMLGLALAGSLLASCGLIGPQPECEPASPDASATISCEEAVSLARAQLSPDHPDISRIQFLYGSYQPGSGGRIPPVGSASGAVIFTFADASRQAVQVSLFQGELTAASPGPY